MTTQNSNFTRLAFWLALAAAATMSPLPAQPTDVPQPKSHLRQKLSRPRYIFNQNDFVRGRLDRGIKPTYFVGEPVVIPIILSNHTNYPITISTNFIPRSQLQVIIRQPGKPSRAYHGPYASGTYSLVDLFLYPLEEFRHPFVVWSDHDQPGNIAFPEPGEYTIDLTLNIAIIEGGQPGKLPLGTVTVRVVPPDPRLEPAVKAIMDDGAVFYLHQRKLPPGWEPTALKLLDLPANPLMPYISLAYGDFLQENWNVMRTDPDRRDSAEKVADTALFLYESAARSDSAYKLEAYNSWLRFLDLLGRSHQARQVALDILQTVPEDRLGKLGNLKLIKKYLINTDELEPSRYWTVMN